MTTDEGPKIYTKPELILSDDEVEQLLMLHHLQKGGVSTTVEIGVYNAFCLSGLLAILMMNSKLKAEQLALVYNFGVTLSKPYVHTDIGRRLIDDWRTTVIEQLRTVSDIPDVAEFLAVYDGDKAVGDPDNTRWVRRPRRTGGHRPGSPASAEGEPVG